MTISLVFIGFNHKRKQKLMKIFSSFETKIKSNTKQMKIAFVVFVIYDVIMLL